MTIQTIPEVITTTIKIPSMAVKARTMAGDIPFWIGGPTPNVNRELVRYAYFVLTIPVENKLSKEKKLPPKT